MDRLQKVLPWEKSHKGREETDKMALKKCEECDNLFDSKADKCPNCGKIIEKKQGLRYLGFILVAVIAGIAGTQAIGFFERKTSEKAPLQKPKIEFESQEGNKSALAEKIEEHYQNLLALYRNNQLDKAAGELQVFKNFGKADYKDVAVIEKNLTIRRLEEKVKKIPSSDPSENLEIYKQLRALDPGNPKYKKRVEVYTARIESKRRKERQLGEQRRKEEEEKLTRQKELQFFGKAPF